MTIQVSELFSKQGAELVIAEEAFRQKILQTTTYLFDWDGVWNAGIKGGGQHSPFSEADAMGTNMVRFAHWLRTGQMPYVAIITGAENQAAFQLALREHFDAVYFNFHHKIEAFQHLQPNNVIDAKQVAFCFDDVLDCSLAEIAGLRFLVRRKASPLFIEYVKQKNLCDYITASEGNAYAIREVCEFILGMQDIFETTLNERIAFSQKYIQYLEDRSRITTKIYTKKNQQIVLMDQNNN